MTDNPESFGKQAINIFLNRQDRTNAIKLAEDLCNEFYQNNPSELKLCLKGIELGNKEFEKPQTPLVSKSIVKKLTNFPVLEKKSKPGTFQLREERQRIKKIQDIKDYRRIIRDQQTQIRKYRQMIRDQFQDKLRYINEGTGQPPLRNPQQNIKDYLKIINYQRKMIHKYRAILNL